MIQKIVHQTWHSLIYTRNDGTPASWKYHNPDWEYRLWTDPELDAFVAKNYPEFIALYREYPMPVQRADLGRYLLLHHFGGVYSDMDTDCLAPLDAITAENRILLCDEPRSHWDGLPPEFALDRFVFNGTMASPAGHPFWLHVAALAKRNRFAAPKNVLISTGPILLSAAVKSWPTPEDFSLNSCQLFAPVDKHGKTAQDLIEGDYAALRLSRHNWAGSWFSEISLNGWKHIKGNWREFIARIKRPAAACDEQSIDMIDCAMLLSAPRAIDLKNLPQIAIFVPVKDGAEFLDRHMALIEALDWPKERLRLVYCEGDSFDDSRARLEVLQAHKAAQFNGIEILTHSAGLKFDRKDRWRPALQLQRRSTLAAARNTLIREGLHLDDEWVLWLDVDVCDFPSDILHTLLGAGEKIVTPDCVLTSGGPSYDLNAYLDVGVPQKYQFFKYVTAGLFQPPINYDKRLHMHDLRFLDKVELTAVGGTMLLVHASVHQAGLCFPETPYHYVIETEAFGRMARDAGLSPVGLPNVEIVHVTS